MKNKTIKTIMFNPITKDCLITQSNPDSNRWSKLISEGYQVVGQIRGFNVAAFKHNIFK